SGLAAIISRIIPSDENGPGALEARADHYIDRALAGAFRAQKPAYAAGLAALDTYARSSKGAPFAKLSPVDQDSILIDMEQNRATGFAGNSSQFFNLVRTHTIQGTFCDPYYGGNARDLTETQTTRDPYVLAPNFQNLQYDSCARKLAGKITREELWE